MRKLRLNLDALQVESFETDEARAARGTVLGNEELSYYCETWEQDCRTAGHASCQATRCVSCSTGGASAQCEPTWNCV